MLPQAIVALVQLAALLAADRVARTQRVWVARVPPRDRLGVRVKQEAAEALLVMVVTAAPEAWPVRQPRAVRREARQGAGVPEVALREAQVRADRRPEAAPPAAQAQTDPVGLEPAQQGLADRADAPAALRIAIRIRATDARSKPGRT